MTEDIRGDGEGEVGDTVRKGKEKANVVEKGKNKSQ